MTVGWLRSLLLSFTAVSKPLESYVELDSAQMNMVVVMLTVLSTPISEISDKVMLRNITWYSLLAWYSLLVAGTQNLLQFTHKCCTLIYKSQFNGEFLRRRIRWASHVCQKCRMHISEANKDFCEFGRTNVDHRANSVGSWIHCWQQHVESVLQFAWLLGTHYERR